MRFFSDGPDIPEELLEACDNGNVIFFCGAGVSIPAGLPGFRDLAKDVLHEVGAPHDAMSKKLLEKIQKEIDNREDYITPLDVVFNLLRKEYGEQRIDELVAKHLQVPPDADTRCHEIVLKLSRNSRRIPQIVTTNFDRLFEEASTDEITPFIPPILPDSTHKNSFEGVVYLHGRISETQEQGAGQGLILSSSDFGRAYLADGWATRFVKNLLQNHVIVLLGYRADDPPIRYLLEGLHSIDGSSYSIYAFEEGFSSDVQANWGDRGVTGLAYPKSAGHVTLWNTLEAWAKRADDVVAWRNSIVKLAQQSPITVEPHERGQVMSLVSGSVGASLFAKAEPVPPAEWLCVMDPNIRMAYPQHMYGQADLFDPHLYYRLDSDFRRQPESTADRAPAGTNYLQAWAGEVDQSISIAGFLVNHASQLPSRLNHLSFWIEHLLDDPVTAWWLAGHLSINPNVLRRIEWQLDQKNVTGNALVAWELLLESFYNAPENGRFDDWFSFTHTIRTRGWSRGLLRQFELVAIPYLKSQRALYQKTYIPVGKWEDIGLSAVAAFDVEFPPVKEDQLDVPAEYLPDVFRVVRRGLEYAASIYSEISVIGCRTPTFHPDKDAGDDYHDEQGRYVLWAVQLLDRLVGENLEFVKNEVRNWPQEEPSFFDKFNIYACIKPELYSGSEVAKLISNLSDDAFWNSDHRRELLFTLRERWSDFSESERKGIEARLLRGDCRPHGDDDADYKKYIAVSAATSLGWLELNKCAVSPETHEKILELRKVNSSWRPSWDENIADSNEGRCGPVMHDTDTSELDNVSSLALVEKIKEISGRTSADFFTEKKPFVGLVKKNPRRALLALLAQAHRDNYPKELWNTYLSFLPKDRVSRVSQISAHKIVRFPPEVFPDLSRQIVNWLRDYLPVMAKDNRANALSVWGLAFDQLKDGGEVCFSSGIGGVSIRGVKQELSRRTLDHAINSPAGRLTEALISILGDMEIPVGTGIPDSMKSHFNSLFAQSGIVADYSINVTASKLNYLYNLEPSWVEHEIIPFFSTESESFEPAWNGFLYSRYVMVPELFELMKASFISACTNLKKWKWEDRIAYKFADYVVILAWLNADGGKYLNHSECRSILREFNDEGRAHSIWELKRIVKEHSCWDNFGKQFIKNAWPLERHCQSQLSAQAFVDLALESGDNFDDVVEEIFSLLVPIKRLDFFIRKSSKGESSLAESYPLSMLKLMDKVIPERLETRPFNLQFVLGVIADVSPELKQDSRWKRLYQLAHS